MVQNKINLWWTSNLVEKMNLNTRLQFLFIFFTINNNLNQNLKKMWESPKTLLI